MITLTKAILYENTRKSKVLTWGVYIPFVSPFIARRVVEIRNKIIGGDKSEDLNKYSLTQNLALRQKIYESLLIGLKYADGDLLKQNMDLFEQLFFFRYDPKKNKNFLADKIAELDDKIAGIIGEVEESGEGRTLSQTVSDIELILNNGMINRNITLLEFKDYYDNAILIMKQRQKNG